MYGSSRLNGYIQAWRENPQALNLALNLLAKVQYDLSWSFEPLIILPLANDYSNHVDG